jgi:4-hydroxyacetophenone monooxygenase
MSSTEIESSAALAINDEELRASLAVANLPTLVMVLAQLTEEDRFLREPYLPTAARGLDDHDSGGYPPDVQAQIREEAFNILRIWRDSPRPLPPPLADARLLEMMRVATAEQVEPAQVPMIREQIGLAPEPAWRAPVGAIPNGVVVVGAGMSGILAAIRLEQAGVAYTVIEKNDRVGGTWYENRYPGCGVDTPGHLYGYSFDQQPWSRFYPPGAEVDAYLERCADNYGVRENIRFRTELTEARWRDDAKVWRLTVRNANGSEEQLECAVLISAMGQLNRPKIPPIPGLADFAGPVLHTAAWDPSVELAGREVSVIGTGASAMQFVPAVADEVRRLTVFQRSPQWAAPNAKYRQEIDRDLRRLFEQIPYYREWYRFRLFWIFNDKVYAALQKDPEWPHPERSVNAVNDRHRQFLTAYIEAELGERSELLDSVLPTYPPFGKRMLMDCGWYRTMTREDVDLLTGGIERVEPEGVVDAEGVLHPADVIVLATGFESLHLLSPARIFGRSGTEIHRAWGEDDARAYLGITVPDMPNFFCLYGPNTNPGHGGSVVFQAECQVHYVIGLLRQMVDADVSTVEVRHGVYDEYNERVDAAHERMIWTHRGMDTWYRNSRGRVVTNTPWRFVDYWTMTRDPRLDDYHLS